MSFNGGKLLCVIIVLHHTTHQLSVLLWVCWEHVCGWFFSIWVIMQTFGIRERLTISCVQHWILCRLQKFWMMEFIFVFEHIDLSVIDILWYAQCTLKLYTEYWIFSDQTWCVQNICMGVRMMSCSSCQIPM